MDFIYTKTPNAAVPLILIDKHIGDDETLGPGIQGDQLLNELIELKKLNKAEVDVWINSIGGIMMQAYNIFGGLRNIGLKVNTLNYGMAASCSGWIWQAGDVIRMMDYANYMCHDPYPSDGKKDSADENMTLSVAIMIAARSGRNAKAKLSVDDVLNLMKRTTFLTAQECYDLGLCDEVVLSSDYDKEISENINQAKDTKGVWELANKYVNKIIEHSVKTNSMPENKNLNEITNVLSLNEDASTESIAKAVSRMKNEMEDSAKKMKDMEDKLNKLEAENKSLKEKNDEYENKAKEREEEDKKATANKLEEDCKNMVNKYKNRLGSDDKTLAEWVNTAKTIGLEKAETMIKAIPLNAKATTVSQIVNKTPEEGAALIPKGMTAAAAMAAKRNQFKN